MRGNSNASAPALPAPVQYREAGCRRRVDAPTLSPLSGCGIARGAHIMAMRGRCVGGVPTFQFHPVPDLQRVRQEMGQAVPPSAAASFSQRPWPPSLVASLKSSNGITGTPLRRGP
jgi:hypothetical protein